MSVFQKKTTLVHHIAYMGLMTAINVIFIVLATYVPFLLFLLILVLPFVSAVVSYYCQKRYYIIYALASIGLCLVFNISDTIFYVAPAVITGFLIGVLLDKKANPFWLILLSSLVESAITYALIPLINLISGADIVTTFLTIFKLNEFTYKVELTYLFIFLISLAQCSLTHFVMLSDANKIGIMVNLEVKSLKPYIVGEELVILASLICSLLYAPLAYVFLAISFYFAIFLLLNLSFIKKPLNIVLSIVFFITGFFIFVIFYTKIIKPYDLILSIVFPIGITILSFINNCLLKQESKI